MVTPIVYVICGSNCKYEGMTKEQILTAITQAVNEGTIGDIDTGFVTTIKTVNGHGLKFFVGTQAEYLELSASDRKDLFAIITDDTTKEGLLKTIETLQTDFDELKEIVTSGEVEAYRKKSDARQYIEYAKLDQLIYSSSTSSQPRVDISSLMLPKKSDYDIIGISGRLIITVGGNDIQVHFSSYFNSYGYSIAEITPAYIYNGKAYLFDITIGIDSQRRVYISGTPQAWNIAGNSEASVNKIKLYYLNIFYK